MAKNKSKNREKLKGKMICMCEKVKSGRHLKPPTSSSPCNQACCRGKEPRWPAAGEQWRSWWSATCTGHKSGVSQLWKGWGTRGGRYPDGWRSEGTKLEEHVCKQMEKYWFHLRSQSVPLNGFPYCSGAVFNTFWVFKNFPHSHFLSLDTLIKQS